MISPGSIDFSEDSSTYFAMIKGSMGGLVKGDLCCFMPLQRHLKLEVCEVSNIFSWTVCHIRQTIDRYLHVDTSLIMSECWLRVRQGGL